MKHDLTDMSVMTFFWDYKNDDGYFQWAGPISRIRDNQWTSHITTWKPYEGNDL